MKGLAICKTCGTDHSDNGGKCRGLFGIKQEPTWSGEGLPPVGVECEHCPGGATQTEWEVVRVLAINERPGGIFTDFWLQRKDGSNYIIGNPYRFRPILSPEEVEMKKERSEECDRIFGILSGVERTGNRSGMAEALYDAGYRKME